MVRSTQNVCRSNEEKAKNNGKTKFHKTAKTKLIDIPIREIRVAVFKFIAIPFFLNILPAYFIRPF